MLNVGLGQAASLANIRVILADVDGTLFRSPTDTLEHIARHIRKVSRIGIRFSVATGRAIAGVRTVVRRLEEAHGDWTARRWTMPAVAYNGAVVAIPAEPVVLDRLVMSSDAVAKAIATVLDADCTALAYVCRQPFDLNYTERVYGYTRTRHHPQTEFNGMPIIWSPDSERALQDVVAMLVTDPDGTGNVATVAAALQARQLPVRVTTSGGPYLEITNSANSKLRGMRTLAHRLGCELNQIMAIGDNLNDVEMLDHAGFGVAVANAPDTVRCRVQYVSAFPAGEGVVDALRLLLQQHRAVRSARLLRDAHARTRR